MRKKAAIIIVFASLCGLAAYYYAYMNNRQEETSFRTTGIIEALEVQIESKIPGRLVHIGFREGDPVKAGELVAEIDPAEAQAVRSQAEATVATARRSLGSGYASLETARAKHGAALADSDRAGAEVSRAKASLSQSELDLKRAVELFDKGVIPRSELDRATTDRDTLQAALDAARAAHASAISSAGAAAAAVTEAESGVSTLKARVTEAEMALGLADVRLSDTKIYSPIDGVVDYRFLEDGETLAPGTPILTLIDPGDVWARIDVDERYVSRIRPGQSAGVSLEYMPEKVFEGTVFDIGREGEFATERDVTRGRQDVRTFRMRIRIDDPEGILKPGMTVICEIPYN